MIAETRIVAIAKLDLFVTRTETDINKVRAHIDLKNDLQVPPPEPTTLCINQCIDKKPNVIRERSKGETSTALA